LHYDYNKCITSKNTAYSPTGKGLERSPGAASEVGGALVGTCSGGVDDAVPGGDVCVLVLVRNGTSECHGKTGMGRASTLVTTEKAPINIDQPFTHQTTFEAIFFAN
jgi:hypothetical protein